MANIMDIVKLRNKTQSNGFDLSRKRNFSAKAGELLPCFMTPVLPGDTFKFSIKQFTRTQDVNTAAFARMREYVDYYFVPMEVLWNKSDSVITQMFKNVQHASGRLLKDNVVLDGSFPHFTCKAVATYINGLVNDTSANKGIFGFERAFMTVKLLRYLGYPDFSTYLVKENTWEKKPMTYNHMLLALPLMCYQKVYADHQRYTQWENPNPSCFNCDYIKGQGDTELDLTDLDQDYNMFDMRFANIAKDLFFGVLPAAQYGETAEFGDINTLSPDTSFTSVGSWMQARTPSSNIAVGDPLQIGSISTDLGFFTPKVGNSTNPLVDLHLSNSSLQLLQEKLLSSFNVLSLRRAESLQRWKEITQSQEQDYKIQVESHWDVSVSSYKSHLSTWLGGYSSNLDINPVVNNNLADPESSTTIKGTGTFALNGNFEFHSEDMYGFIIGIYHVKPIFDYSCGQINPAVLLTEATDWPIPEMDNIGMEQLPIAYLANPIKGEDPNLDLALQRNTYLGYVPRYVTFKTSFDEALGAFANNEKSWVLPFTLDMLKQALTTDPRGGGLADWQLDWTFFKVNPRFVDTIFKAQADSTYDSDVFRVSQFTECYVSRKLDVNGLPY